LHSPKPCVSAWIGAQPTDRAIVHRKRQFLPILQVHQAGHLARLVLPFLLNLYQLWLQTCPYLMLGARVSLAEVAAQEAGVWVEGVEQRSLGVARCSGAVLVRRKAGWVALYFGSLYWIVVY